MQKIEEPVANHHKPAALAIKKTRSVRLFTVVLLVIVVAIVAFIGGTRADMVASLFVRGQNADTPTSLDFSSLQEVYRALREHYDGELDTQKLIEGAKKGLVEATSDPYTVYFTDDEARQFNDDLAGKFSGIGAEIGQKNSNLIVVTTLDDSPARKAGLQTDDIIAKVNDEETTGWSIDQAVSTIRGDKGTTVKLAIVRNQELKEFSIIRDNIVNPSVKHEITPDGIGYLRISRFAEDTENRAATAAREFIQKGVKGVVLDVRGNGGGYLEASQAVAGLWLEQGKSVVEERGTRDNKTLRAQGDSVLKGVPTVVLIDGGSASASEIVAGALNDHNAAKLVGTKTYGKGSVQQLVDLPLGGQIKITVAKWYTPGGKNIDKEGIEPSEKVEISDADIAAGNDPQKAKAIELLKK